MDVLYRVLYISKTGIHNLKQPWWDARKFATAVKTANVNGFFHIPRGLFNQRVEQKNVGDARQYFGLWLLNMVNRYADGEDVSLVPIPSSDAAISRSGPFRHYQAVEASVRWHTHTHEIQDILRFTEPQKKAHEDGPRFEDQVFPLLALAGKIPKRPIVLVDDIMTSGGHMKACKRKLEKAGGKVLFGVVCGRTVSEAEGDPWKSGTAVP